MPEAPPPVTCTIDDGVAILRIDDGKVNVLGQRVLELLGAGLDQARDEARSVAIVGREGRFSAGFDLVEMGAGIDRTRALVASGGRMLMRIFGHPQPVVAAVTGHALAAGALLVLACDTRVGSEGSAKIGLNETAIGMGLPEYGIQLARARLSPAHLTRAAVQAEIYDPVGALEAGYLDRVVPAADCEPVTVGEARRLGELPAAAYRHTKLALRHGIIDGVLANIEHDVSTLITPDR